MNRNIRAPGSQGAGHPTATMVNKAAVPRWVKTSDIREKSWAFHEPKGHLLATILAPDLATRTFSARAFPFAPNALILPTWRTASNTLSL